MKRLLLPLFVLALAADARAQVVTEIPPQRLSLLVIPATGDAMTVPSIAASTINVPSTGTGPCNLLPSSAPTLPPPYVNPRTARVPDPFNAGRECEFLFPTTIAGGAPIPNGSYRITAVAVSDACVTAPSPTPVTCEGPRTAVSVPFSVVLSARPAALTGLRISQ